MIVIAEKEFMRAMEGLLVAIAETATDGNGLKIVMRIDPEKFAASVLSTAGILAYGEVPYLKGENESFPIKAFRRGDLTDFMSSCIT